MTRMEQEIHFCKTADGVRIAYATVGQGPSLVKAANWLNHLEFDWQSPIWRHLLDEFARDHLLVRYDERGNGLSDWNVDDLSFEAFVRDFESVVDAVGLEHFPILGISQGGPVAIAYAVRHPEKVSHLILYGSYARGWAKRGASQQEMELRQAQLTLIKLGWGQDNPAFRQMFTNLYIPGGTPEQWQWFNDLQKISASPENAYRLLNELGKIDVVDLLPQVKVPTLVLHCRDDSAVPFEAGRLLASSIPGARFIPLEGKNHLLLDTEPSWPKFVNEVRGFLGAIKPPLRSRSKIPSVSKPESKAPSLGDSIGRYTIKSLLGEGGMGQVFLAEDTRLRRSVALKVLPGDLAANVDRMRRFVQEAQAAAALNHPNIAHIYEIGEDDGVHFIAMEFIDGKTLRELIHHQQADLGKLLRYLQHAAEGLAKAHAAGIVHRDLKPDNIMVTREGHAKILDFGLVKLVEPQSASSHPSDPLSEVATALMQRHSTPGVVLGTVGYMSPEQAQGKTNEIDHRSDIFSFGCILYEAITRRRAFEGKDVIESLNKIIREQPSAITNFKPDTPYDLQKVVRRCLAKDPEERYQTIKDVAIELKDVRSELQASAGIDTSVPPSPNTVSSSQAIIDSDSSRTAAAQSSLSPVPSTYPSSAEYIISGIKQHRVAAGIVGGVLVLVMAAIGIGLYKFIGGKKSASVAMPKLQRLTTSGKASDAAISPDGKYVAHVKSDAGQQSLWLRQVATTSDTQIVPPSTQTYFGITFSKDGDYIYYVQGERTDVGRTLYQVPMIGGASRKVIENVASPVSLSPDGTRLAFIRITLGRGESALVVANADGTGERPVAMRKVPNPFNSGGPSWSPDGKLIASCVIAQGSDGAAVTTVVEVQVESGAERPITSQNWPPQTLPQVAWLTDGNGLLLQAAERGSASSQIWHISYPAGEVRKITNDLNNYSRLSLTADSSTLVTIQTEGASTVWVAPEADAIRAKQISAGRYDGQQGLSWMPGGKLVYTSRESGAFDIWSMEEDGKNQKQLTAHAGFNYHPWATPDGRYIVFTSTRSRATRGIWRMDTDGGNLKELTEGPGDLFPQSSPDGRWVVFHSQRSGSLRVWKVSIDGGEPVRLTDNWTANPTVSPDGNLIACFYREDQPNAPVKVAIIPFAGGDPIKVLDLPRPSFTGAAGLRWTPDGRALTYIDTINGVSNVWSLPLDGGAPKRLTDFKTDQIFSFNYSRDGKQLALSRGTQTSDVILIRDFR